MFGDRVRWGTSARKSIQVKTANTQRILRSRIFRTNLSLEGTHIRWLNQDIGVPGDIPQRPVDRSRIHLLVLDLWTDGTDRYRYGHRAAALLVVVDFRHRRCPPLA